jgi:hypothetical protein
MTRAFIGFIVAITVLWGSNAILLDHLVGGGES